MQNKTAELAPRTPGKRAKSSPGHGVLSFIISPLPSISEYTVAQKKKSNQSSKELEEGRVFVTYLFDH